MAVGNHPRSHSSVASAAASEAAMQPVLLALAEVLVGGRGAGADAGAGQVQVSSEGSQSSPRKKKQRRDGKQKADGAAVTAIRSSTTRPQRVAAATIAAVKMSSKTKTKPATGKKASGAKTSKAGKAAAKGTLKPSKVRGSKKATKARQTEANDDAEDADEEYTVTKILRHRTRRGKVEVQVRWKGYTAASDSWEPLENVDGNTAYVKYAKANGLKKKKK